MEKGAKIAFGIGGVVLLSAGVYFGFIRKYSNGLTLWQGLVSPPKTEDEQKQVEQQKQQTATQTNTVYTPPPIASGFPIAADTHNTNVPQLQSVLMNKFGLKIPGAVTNYLGANTIKALKSIGYTTPLSKADFDSVIAGVKKNQSSPATIKVGDDVYADVDNVGIYTKPIVDSTLAKKIYSKYDKIGVYYGPDQVSGWARVYSGEFDNPYLYVPMAELTNKI